MSYTCAVEARRAWRLVGRRWRVFAVLSLSWGEIVAVVLATTMPQAPPE